MTGQPPPSPERLQEIRDKGWLSGIPFRVDESVPPGCVELHDEDGIVKRIGPFAQPSGEGQNPATKRESG